MVGEIGVSGSGAEPSTAWPVKTRELQTYVLDSTRWNDVAFRDDDIIIATWSKAGTTWVQQIVAQLIFDGADEVSVGELSPWMDMRLIPRDALMAHIEAQTHRRFLKTHLPVDALAFSPKAKYIYIGRDARDILWSWYNHHASFTPLAYEMMNNSPGLVGPPLEPPNPDIRQYFHDWLDRDGYPSFPFWSHVRSWWAIRDLPNVMLVHFANLKADMPGEIRKIAAFLDIEIDEATWPEILEHCGFDYMKAHAEKFEPMADAMFTGGPQSFINKGTNNRWRDVLTPEDIRKCDDMALRELGPECARWLATGELPGR